MNHITVPAAFASHDEALTVYAQFTDNLGLLADVAVSSPKDVHISDLLHLLGNVEELATATDAIGKDATDAQNARYLKLQRRVEGYIQSVTR